MIMKRAFAKQRFGRDIQMIQNNKIYCILYRYIVTSAKNGEGNNNK